MLPSIETDRLLLRPFSAHDVDNLYELDSDPEVMRWLTGGDGTPRDTVEHRVLPRFMREDQTCPGLGVWAAIERTTGEFVGWFSLRPPDGGTPDNVELGYRLRRTAWGRGYATEGAHAMIERGFRELGVRRVFATTYQDNLGSRRVLEKCGLTHVRSYRVTVEDLLAEGTFDATGDDVWDGDDVEYALERADWERQSQMTTA